MARQAFAVGKTIGIHKKKFVIIEKDDEPTVSYTELKYTSNFMFKYRIR